MSLQHGRVLSRRAFMSERLPGKVVNLLNRMREAEGDHR